MLKDAKPAIFATKGFVIFSFILSCIMIGNTIYMYIMEPIDKTVIWLFIICLLTVLNFGYQYSYYLGNKIIYSLDAYIDVLEKDQKENVADIFKFMKSHQQLLNIYKEIANADIEEETKKENVYTIVKQALSNYIDENREKLKEYENR